MKVEWYRRPLSTWVDGDAEVFVGIELHVPALGKRGTIIGARTALDPLEHFGGGGAYLDLEIAYLEDEQ